MRVKSKQRLLKEQLNNEYGLIFVALPYATADLHLGRLMGTFLPADVYRRYLLKFKLQHNYLCSGLDCFGTSVYLNSVSEGISPNQLCQLKNRNFLRQLKLLGIDLRFDFMTTNRAHKKFVRAQVDHLIQSNKVVSEPVKVAYCDSCELHLADRFLETEKGTAYQKLLQQNVKFNKQELRCTICKKVPRWDLRNNYVLKYQETCPRWIQFKRRLNVTESGKEVGRFFTEWGILGSSFSAQKLGSSYSYYVWIEALYSYLQQYLRLKKFKSKEPQNVSYFYGKDNEYYHLVIYPQLIEGSVISPCNSKVKTFKRNYVLAERNQKMSSSKKNLLHFESLNLDPDLVRFALASLDPLRNDVVVKPQLVREKCKLFHNKYVNLVKRCQGLLKNTTTAPTKSEKDLSKYHEAMQANDLKKALNQVMMYQKEVSKWIDEKIKQKKPFSSKQRGLLKAHVRTVLLMLEPFVPRTVRKLRSRV